VTDTCRRPWSVRAGVALTAVFFLLLYPASAAPAKKPKPKPKPARVTTTKPVGAAMPPPFTIPTGALTEASGCAITKADPDTVWLHNDSGNAPELFALSLSTKKVRTVGVVDVKLVDWEDIAAYPGGGVIVGDIGDNESKRTSVQLYRIADLARSPLTAVLQNLTYDDGPHNAEALVVDPDAAHAASPAVYVITKEETGRSAVYRADGSVLRKIGPLTISGEVPIFGNQITAGAALPDGSGFILRTYQYAYLFRRPVGKPFEASFGAAPVRIDLPPVIQGEAICVLQDGKTAITTTESRGATTLPVVFVALP
jgi:hypothetical protein